MFEARLWKLLRNSEAQPKFTLSYKKNYVYTLVRAAIKPKYQKITFDTSVRHLPLTGWRAIPVY